MSPNIIELDGVTIDALASVTRRNILKKIKLKPMTVSELARELVINKSAIFRHLHILQEADLISKRKNDNEFVYYELTTKGKDTTEQHGNIKIVILLTTSGFVFIVGLFTIFKSVEKLITPQYWTAPSIDILQLLIGSAMVLSAALILFFGFRRREK